MSAHCVGCLQLEFVVGKRHKSYDGFREMTEDDLQNLNMRARLMAAHGKFGNLARGWPLLEEPLVVNDPILHVHEGRILINWANVSLLGSVNDIDDGYTEPYEVPEPEANHFASEFRIQGVFSPEWIQTPELDACWRASRFANSDQGDVPCLFVLSVR